MSDCKLILFALFSAFKEKRHHIPYAWLDWSGGTPSEANASKLRTGDIAMLESKTVIIRHRFLSAYHRLVFPELTGTIF